MHDNTDFNIITYVHQIGCKQQGMQSDVSIVVAGDLCPMGETEYLLCANQPEKVFSDLLPYIIESQLAIVNLECPLTHSQTPIIKSGPHLQAAPACAEGIRSGGFDVVTLANNHILDMGERGLFDTLSTCHAAGLKTVGAGKNLEEATQPLIVDIRGLKVAILAFTEHEFSIASSHKAGAWPLDPIDNYWQIQEAKKRANFVLVLLHGGNEYYPLPSPRVCKTCRKFVDWGASAVISHHTHVPSGVEIYRGVPIVYGTGNFLFDRPSPQPKGWNTGYLVNLKVQANAQTDIQLIPFQQRAEQPGICKMSAADAERFMSEIARLSSVIADENAMASAWEQFCKTKREEYISGFFAMNRIERRLLRWGIWPFWRCGQTRVSELLNLVRCESHRDVLTSVLMSELEKKGR